MTGNRLINFIKKNKLAKQLVSFTPALFGSGEPLLTKLNLSSLMNLEVNRPKQGSKR